MWWQQSGGSVQRESVMCSREEQLWVKVSQSHEGEEHNSRVSKSAFNPFLVVHYTHSSRVVNAQALGTESRFNFGCFYGASRLLYCQNLCHWRWYEIQIQDGAALSFIPADQERLQHKTDSFVWYHHPLLTNMFLLWFWNLWKSQRTPLKHEVNKSDLSQA